MRPGTLGPNDDVGHSYDNPMLGRCKSLFTIFLVIAMLRAPLFYPSPTATAHPGESNHRSCSLIVTHARRCKRHTGERLSKPRGTLLPTPEKGTGVEQ
eukprot:scaffold258127_cov29-Tisochrysis_lutea.AAC.3